MVPVVDGLARAIVAAINDALVRSVSDAKDRDAGLFTFLVTASGVSFLGLSAPFWGLLLGLTVHVVMLKRRPVSVGATSTEG